MLVYYINFVLVAFLEVSWTGSKIIYPTEDRGLFALMQTEWTYIRAGVPQGSVCLGYSF